jgi:hypothetical protein
MSKKIFAVTNIKVGQDPSEFFAAGTEVDPTKFTMEQLKILLDDGAIEVKLVEDEAASAPVVETVGEAPEAFVSSDVDVKLTNDDEIGNG